VPFLDTAAAALPLLDTSAACVAPVAASDAFVLLVVTAVSSLSDVAALVAGNEHAVHTQPRPVRPQLTRDV
jgi:hypothetical protein